MSRTTVLVVSGIHILKLWEVMVVSSCTNPNICLSTLNQLNNTTDNKIMLEFLEKRLVVKDLSQATHRRIELEMGTFLAVVWRAIAESTPWARPSQWSISDFGAGCREMVKTARALRRRYT